MIKDDDKVWKIVKAQRQFYLLNTTIRSCQTGGDKALLSFYEIEKNIQEIEMRLKVSENSDNQNCNIIVSRSYIQAAGNMFTYLILTIVPH